jgi:phosphate transport system substrate-binding protein
MSNRIKTLSATAFVVVVLSAVAGCSAKTSSAPSTPVSLKGEGATAPYFVYSKWMDAYRNAEPRVHLQYEPTGSGAGIQALKAQTVDFAASDIPLTDEEIGKMAVKPLHFPTLVGAIVPVYNVLKVGTLNFTGEVLAGIFSGRIRSWNDRALLQLNSKAALPASPIIVVHRGDSSGSTYAFTDYLSQVSDTWKKEIGHGGTVRWPVGEAASGNPALSELVKKTPYSIGYVELNYAIHDGLTYGFVRNAEGKFEKPDFRAMGAAANAVENMKTEFRASIANSPAKGAYPICTLTWLIVPSHIADARKLREMKRFLRWAYSDGQEIALKMDYGILQPPFLNYVRDQIGQLN